MGVSGVLRSHDTPARPCSANRYCKMYREKDTAAVISQAVHADVSRNFRVADTHEFLRRILPVPEELLDLVLQTLTDDGTYDRVAQRWNGMPESDQVKEEAFYDPFCKIANSIRKCVEEHMAGLGKKNQAVKGVWLNRAKKPPQSADEFAALIRPDCIFTTNTDTIKTLDEDIETADREVQNDQPTSDETHKRLVISFLLFCSRKTLIRISGRAVKGVVASHSRSSGVQEKGISR